MSHRAVLLSAVGLLIVSTVLAKEMQLTIGNFPFWTAPKREYADQFVPGLNAVLLLTQEQIVKLHEARRETIDSDAVRPIRQKDPNATEAERTAIQKRLADAQASLRVRVSNILTAEQRSLIDQINAAHAEAVKQVAEQFQARLIASKGNDQEQENLRKEIRERTSADFVQKVQATLTPAQRIAFDKAAEAEKAAALKPKK